jgi:hypothetical protein
MAIGLATFAAASLACAADASIVNFVSNPGLEGLGAFAGSMEWTYLGGNAGTLRVSLTNTSPVDNGGYLTGFAFNTAYELQVKVAENGARTGWVDIFDIDANPLGTFDHGAAVGGNWLGGGSPLAGIGVGQTFDFVFDVRGDPALVSNLIAHDFFDESEGWGFAARFRGFNDDGSDKVTASMPAPGVLTALGFGALNSRRRRR